MTQGVGAAAASQPPPEDAIREALGDWARVAIDGVAVLDEADRYLYVNPAGCRMLGSPLGQLRGRTAFFGGGLGPERSRAEWTSPAWVRWAPLDGHPELELEYRQFPWAVRDDRLTLLTIREVSAVRLQQRRIAAFATAAANLTYGRSLRSTLDAISDEVVRSTGLAGAQIVLIDPSGDRMRVHGAAPIEAWPQHFTLLLEQARRRGAALNSIEAFRTKRPVVARQRKTKLLADPAWEPLHQQLESFEWDTFVSVPLLVRGQALGALNAYYRPGQDPDDDDIEFLTAMSDQAAVAVENARLLVESRDKAALDERHRLARELHDSACQQLFSLTLHIRAAQLALPGSGLGADSSIGRSLQTIDHLAHAALEEMRALILELHPTVLHLQGLVAVVRDQAAAIASREGLHIRVEAEDQRLEIDPDTELDAYRLIQEALHNAVKHAKAESVSVRIHSDPGDGGTLILEVTDNGIGFDPSVTSGRLGLVSMRERAERMGGELTISSAPAAGTTVRAVIPRVVGAGRREDDHAGET